MRAVQAALIWHLMENAACKSRSCNRIYFTQMFWNDIYDIYDIYEDLIWTKRHWWLLGGTARKALHRGGLCPKANQAPLAHCCHLQLLFVFWGSFFFLIIVTLTSLIPLILSLFTLIFVILEIILLRIEPGQLLWVFLILHICSASLGLLFPILQHLLSFLLLLLLKSIINLLISCLSFLLLLGLLKSIINLLISCLFFLLLLGLLNFFNRWLSWLFGIFNLWLFCLLLLPGLLNFFNRWLSWLFDIFNLWLFCLLLLLGLLNFFNLWLSCVLLDLGFFFFFLGFSTFSIAGSAGSAVFSISFLFFGFSFFGFSSSSSVSTSLFFLSPVGSFVALPLFATFSTFFWRLPSAAVPSFVLVLALFSRSSSSFILLFLWSRFWVSRLSSLSSSSGSRVTPFT